MLVFSNQEDRQTKQNIITYYRTLEGHKKDLLSPQKFLLLIPNNDYMSTFKDSITSLKHAGTLRLYCSEVFCLGHFLGAMEMKLLLKSNTFHQKHHGLESVITSFFSNSN